MNRVVTLSVVTALALLAPRPAHAQGPNNNLNARVAALEAALAAETAARQAADTALQNNITAEASARAAADTTLQTNINAGDTALDARVDKLEGKNLGDGDFIGTYAVHFVATAMDGNPPGSPNQLTSYAITGTATMAADNTGFVTLTAAGIEWTEGTPSQNWARQEVGGVIACNFTWSYSNGTFSMASTNGFCDSNLSVVAGGQVMVTAAGGAPSNNQLIVLFTRK